MSQGILVIGPPRTGTSTITNVLKSLGVFVGEDSFVGDEFNPAGYFLDDKLHTALSHADYGSVAKRIDEFKQHEFWAIKDHRAWQVLDILTPMLGNVKIIRTSRDKQEASTSLLQWRNRGTIEDAKRDFDTFEKLISEWLGKHKFHTYNLAFPYLIDKPRQAVKDIANFLGLQVTEAANEIIKADIPKHRKLRPVSQRKPCRCKSKN